MTILTYHLESPATSSASIDGRTQGLLANKAWKKANGKIIGKWIWFGLAFLGFNNALVNLNNDSVLVNKFNTWRWIMIPLAIITWFGLVMMVLTGAFSGGAGVIALASLPEFLQNYLAIAMFTDMILFTVLVIFGFRARKLYLQELAKQN
jgi:hypothetical protein